MSTFEPCSRFSLGVGAGLFQILDGRLHVMHKRHITSVELMYLSEWRQNVDYGLQGAYACRCDDWVCHKIGAERWNRTTVTEVQARRNTTIRVLLGAGCWLWATRVPTMVSARGPYLHRNWSTLMELNHRLRRTRSAFYRLTKRASKMELDC